VTSWPSRRSDRYDGFKHETKEHSDEHDVPRKEATRATDKAGELCVSRAELTGECQRNR
jgi:hypothetical protein